MLTKYAEVHVELAMMNFSLVVQESSLITYASIYLALDTLDLKFGGVCVDNTDRFI
jgi:hypothetical protein